MNINLKRVKITNKAGQSYYDRNIYDIISKNKYVGRISFIKKNKIIFIKGIYVEDEYQNNSVGASVIEYILNHYSIDCIIGECLEGSAGFWTKMIKKHNGKRRYIHYNDNCTSVFVIPKDNKSIKLTNDYIYDFIKSFY